ncbi:hypothetical protein [Thermanaeromonas sp. C210]|uniref:hypothetical protein n=1 Tax=Thermanaeromonas sp. C210 TaxID=2731925 RepID=UPI00155B6C2F|nr:hypothetical protein [Thermanaeromonas sp. C210]GFN23837.1 hypothetical protein TAMC210_21540 [Thermanaeromonas sp. C210]
MRVIITSHARKRLRELRQEGILTADIVSAARQLPGRIAVATRFRGFMAASGRLFDLVVKDVPAGRIVITVIGK